MDGWNLFSQTPPGAKTVTEINPKFCKKKKKKIFQFPQPSWGEIPFLPSFLPSFLPFLSPSLAPSLPSFPSLYLYTISYPSTSTHHLLLTKIKLAILCLQQMNEWIVGHISRVVSFFLGGYASGFIDSFRSSVYGWMIFATFFLFSGDCFSGLGWFRVGLNGVDRASVIDVLRGSLILYIRGFSLIDTYLEKLYTLEECLA